MKSSLFDGEERKLPLAIENISQIPIASLFVEVTDDARIARNDNARIIFKFNDYNQQLKPGEKMIIEGIMMAQIDYVRKDETLSQFINIKYRGKKPIIINNLQTK